MNEMKGRVGGRKPNRLPSMPFAFLLASFAFALALLRFRLG
jgi:hypothetical protein